MLKSSDKIIAIKKQGKKPAKPQKTIQNSPQKWYNGIAENHKYQERKAVLHELLYQTRMGFEKKNF
jgi:hypothetical protein